MTIDGVDLAQSLQYGPTDGNQELREWLYGLQEKAHGRKRGEGWRISVGSGSQDLIYKVCARAGGWEYVKFQKKSSAYFRARLYVYVQR